MSREAQQQEPAYVIHRRPWRETSLMVDLFTLNHGRLSVIARGAIGNKSPLKAQLQPFQPLLLGWVGRGDLKTLTEVDVREGPLLHRTASLYSGLYLNELMQRILPQADPHPTLFAAYIGALEQLAQASDVEPVLRKLWGTIFYGIWRWILASPSTPGKPIAITPNKVLLLTLPVACVCKTYTGKRCWPLPAGIMKAALAAGYRSGLCAC